MNRWVKRIIIAVVLAAVLLLLSGYGLLKLTGSRSFQFFGGIVTHAETAQPVVALTFDDGPTEKTEEILQILQAENVKATFFLTGADMMAHPEQTKAIIEAGHEIGNHSYSHPRMVFKSYGFIKKEIEETDTLIRAFGYEGPIPFRPPYGRKLLFLPHYLHKHERKTVLWNVEPDSYPEIGTDSKSIIDHTLQNTKPGAIILLHVMFESRNPSIQAVKGIITGLRDQGYTFLRVSELLQQN